MPIFEVRLSPKVPDPTFALSARDLPHAMHSWLSKQHGGSCIGQVSDSIAILEITAPSIDIFGSLVDSFVKSEARRGMMVTAVIASRAASSLTPAQMDLARSLAPRLAKFTKHLLLSQPSGIFIASNILGGPTMEPVFAEPVAGSPDDRLEQWTRVVASGAAQRTCHLFRDAAQFHHWLAGVEARRRGE